jgi:two-component system, sensor histidine kinase and response regulator
MEPSPDARFPDIPGIDCHDLTERIGEDATLLWDLLGAFASGYRERPAQIAAALGQDPIAAKRLSHDLKGVLGNLGATDLFATCRDLDDAIREGRSERYAGLLGDLRQGVPALCDAIERARPGAPEAPARPGPLPAVPDWLAGRYQALQAALAGHRARDCRALADEIAAAPLPAAEQGFFDALQAQVRAYRFKEALALLDGHLAGAGQPDSPQA